MTRQAVREIERCVRGAALTSTDPLVLAVSGGLDSMVLLDAGARAARGRVALVATFDHRTGPNASRAVDFVAREAAARGLPVVVGRATRERTSEAAWRAARWGFLRSVAGPDGVVVTAHTEDDQVETILMRAMRGAGARGLAGLYATAERVQRPLLGVRRATIRDYAQCRGVRWVNDPTNESRRFFRNRVRNDLLPALLRARPELDADLLAIARRAATWRMEVEAFAAAIARSPTAGEHARSVSVATDDLAGYDAESLAVVWPAIAARIGLALDRRGTRRLAAFTISRGRVGASIQLAGGWEVVRDRRILTLRPTREKAPPPAGLPADGVLRWGRWSFSRQRNGNVDPWRAVLPGGLPLVVRAWRAGDRMAGPGGRPRRVKRFLGDAGVIGPDRPGWPVVLAGEEIVWIPGVGCGAAVTGASRTSGLFYTCEFNDR